MIDPSRFLSARALGRNPRLGSRVTSTQSGITLFILILGLAVAMIMITAALPSARFQTKRAKELDLISKGQHIAQGIERFRATTNRYPVSMDELVTGVTVGIRQIHFVRPSAAKDPMTNDEWRLVRPGDPVILEFAEAWQTYTLQPLPASMQALIGAQVTLPGGSSSGTQGQTGSTQGSSFSGDIGPFIAVVSTSKEQSAKLYFGLDSYDKWLFINMPPSSSVPGVPIVQPQQGTPGIGNPVTPGRNGNPGGPGPGPGPGTGRRGPGN